MRRSSVAAAALLTGACLSACTGSDATGALATGPRSASSVTMTPVGEAFIPSSAPAMPAERVLATLPKGRTAAYVDFSPDGVVWSGSDAKGDSQAVFALPERGDRVLRLAGATLGDTSVVSWVGAVKGRAYWVETTRVEMQGALGGPWRLWTCRVSQCHPRALLNGAGGGRGPAAPRPRVNGERVVVALARDFGYTAYAAAEVRVIDGQTARETSRTRLNSADPASLDTVGERLVFETVQPYPRHPVTEPIAPREGLDVFTAPIAGSSGMATALSSGHADHAPAASGDRVVWVQRAPGAGPTGSLWMSRLDGTPEKLLDGVAAAVWFDGRFVVYPGFDNGSLEAVDVTRPDEPPRVVVADVQLSGHDSVALRGGVLTYAAVSNEGEGPTEIRRVDLAQP